MKWGKKYEHICHMRQMQAVLGMSLRKVTLLGSNSASVTDLIRIQTPHSLCCDFEGCRTFTTRGLPMPVSPSGVSWISACPLHELHLCAIRRNRRKDTLEKSILWIFQDLPLICPDQTAREMMLLIVILVEHFRGSIFPSCQGQDRSAKDWEWRPQFYLII